MDHYRGMITGWGWSLTISMYLANHVYVILLIYLLWIFLFHPLIPFQG